MLVSFAIVGTLIEVSRYHNGELIGTRDLSHETARRMYRNLRIAGYEPCGSQVKKSLA